MAASGTQQGREAWIGLGRRCWRGLERVRKGQMVCEGEMLVCRCDARKGDTFRPEKRGGGAAEKRYFPPVHAEQRARLLTGCRNRRLRYRQSAVGDGGALLWHFRAAWTGWSAETGTMLPEPLDFWTTGFPQVLLQTAKCPFQTVLKCPNTTNCNIVNHEL